MDTLPENIVNKILLFVSHPVADIVRTSSEFHYRFLDLEGRTHGSAFDRGCSDSYYCRDGKPHKWTNLTGENAGTVTNLTKEETYEYWTGYWHFPEEKFNVCGVCAEYFTPTSKKDNYCFDCKIGRAHV